MLVWPVKGPDESKDYDIDWTLTLAGDTITGSTWTITQTDSAPTNAFAFSNPIFSGTMTKVTLTGGTPGFAYHLLNEVTTSAGRTYEETVEVLCKVK